MNTQTFYAPVAAMLAVDAAHTDVNGQHRGIRHGLFTETVEQAGKVLASLPEGTYTVRAVGTMAGTPGWAVRVAARKLVAACGEDDSTIEVHAGGRGNPTVVQIRF